MEFCKKVLIRVADLLPNSVGSVGNVYPPTTPTFLRPCRAPLINSSGCVFYDK